MVERKASKVDGSVRLDLCGPATTIDDCRCRAAVTRAYNGMLVGGVPNTVALEAATRVYRYHHPEADYDAAHHTVESWVFRGALH